MTFKYQQTNKIYQCDICGIEDIWSGQWFSYGSILHEETCPHDIATVCSEECKEKLQKRIDSGQVQLPKLTRRGYRVAVSRPRKGY